MKNTSTITSAILASTNSVDDLSTLLAIRKSDLLFAMKSAPRLYREILREKKSGGQRVIRAPDSRLKYIQRAALDEILKWEPIPEYSFGFAKGKTIVDNAKLHSSSPYVLNADIKDFFPSVHFKRIENLYVELGASRTMAKLLTGLTTLEHSLPQGAPTSPYLATLALRKLDTRIAQLCTVNRLIYSRYFDDMTISGGERAHQIFPTLKRIIASEGYAVHTSPGKLKMYAPGETRFITGIEVSNGQLSVPNVKDVETYIRELQTMGMATLRSDNPLKEKMSLRGKIVFITQVNKALGAAIEKEFDLIAW